MDRYWILLGMMGAGKTSVGRALAEHSGRPFRDTDTLLQNRFGRPVSQIFKVYGEAAFRAHETSILRTLIPERAVLSTGGGIVAREENWEEMRRLGTTIYLEVREDVLVDRLENSKKRRPLLEVDDWQGRVSDLLTARKPLYEQADLRVDVTECNVHEAVERVLLALERVGEAP